MTAGNTPPVDIPSPAKDCVGQAGCSNPPLEQALNLSHNNKRMQAMKEISQSLHSELSFFKERSLRPYKNCLKKHDDFFKELIKNPRASQIKDFFKTQLAELPQNQMPDDDFFEAIGEIISCYNEIYHLDGNIKINQNHLNTQLLTANLFKDQLYAQIEERYAEHAWKVETITRNLFICYEIFNLFNIDKATYLIKGSLNKAKELLIKKLDKPAVRSSFAFWLYKYTIEASTKRTSRNDIDLFEKVIPFLTETSMTIMYYHNQVLDQKGGVAVTEELRKVKTNLVSANLLKDLLYNYVDEKLAPCPHDKKKVLHNARLIFSCVDVGQLMDKKVNNYKNFEDEHFKYHFSQLDLFDQKNASSKLVFDFLKVQDLLNSINGEINYGHLKNSIDHLKNQFKESRRGRYFDLYFDRIFLTSGALFKLTAETILDLYGIQDDELKACAVSNAVTYGMMLQVVNDNNDFVKIKTGTIEKKKDDVLCDLKNGTLSLPLIIYFTKNIHTKTIAHKYIGHSPFKMTDRTIKEIQKVLFDSKALDTSIELAKEMVRNQKDFNWFKKTPGKGIFLRDIYSIAFYNKYLTEIQLQEKDLYRPWVPLVYPLVSVVWTLFQKGRKFIAGAPTFRKSLFPALPAS